jgi:hypothetical protein
MESSALSLAVVCEELKRFGLEIDAEALVREAPDSNSLKEVERNLWLMLRRAELDRLGYIERTVETRFGDIHTA